MKKVLGVSLLGVLILSGCATCSRSSRPAHVVLVGFDGLGSMYLDGRAKTPNIDRMRKEGAWTYRSRSVLPSSSAVNWASLFMCAGPEQHGYVKWDTKKPVLPPDSVMRSGCFPDVFALLREARPGAETGYFYQWGGMGYVVDTNSVSRVWPRLSGTGEEAIAYLKERKPELLAIVWDSPDGQGHSKGFGGPEYVAETERLDGVLGNIVKAVEEAGIADDTVIIVTSDHGGLKKSHGSPTPEEMYRPLLFWGKGVCRGREIKSASAIYDVGSSVLHLLGIGQPQVCIGRPVLEAFE